MTLTRTVTVINTENLQKAAATIQEFASKKKLVLEGVISTVAPTSYPSRNNQKRFRASLDRVLKSPSMKSANKFLTRLAGYNGSIPAQVVYSQKEKNIISSRVEWKEALRIAKELKKKYKEEKGDFYKC